LRLNSPIPIPNEAPNGFSMKRIYHKRMSDR
jgi:hypothetical protein